LVRNDVADLYRIICDNDAVNQKFDQLAAQKQLLPQYHHPLNPQAPLSKNETEITAWAWVRVPAG